MSVRTGMADLILRFRRMVANVDAAVFDDDEVQDLLDGNRRDLYQEPLVPISRQVPGAPLGSVTYNVYESRYANLEGSASGTLAFRVYDGLGSAYTPNTIDYLRGRFEYTADQVGSARYLDGRSYDLPGAAGEGWAQLAGLKAELYDFRQEGRSFTRSQWFDHCMKMAGYFSSRRTFASQAVIERGDMI